MIDRLAKRRLRVLNERVNLRVSFAVRMVEHAQFELASGRTVESRVLICRAIDQLDGGLGIIWEFEKAGLRASGACADTSDGSAGTTSASTTPEAPAMPR
jgi:hypothetical protein